MKKRILCSLMSVLCVGMILVAASHAQVPRKMTYQGYLVDARGNPVSGTVEMQFAICGNPLGPVYPPPEYWTETQDVEVEHGQYTVILGDINPIDVSEVQPYWLRITVRRETEYIEITSAMYALFADHALFADTVKDFHTDDSNTFAGRDAGNSNTTGTSNTFMGYGAGHSNETGFFNTFVGTDAGRENTTGSYNTFVGKNAGQVNEIGDHNTFMGNYAGFRNEDGFSNTFIGTNAGRMNTTGTYNTFIGGAAGYSNEGGANTFVGTDAGRESTSGNYNTFMGYGAGYNNEGDSNTFVGTNAGRMNTTGTFNTFIGKDAGRKNITTEGNTFIGWEAGKNATSGYNTFIGMSAGRENSTGFANTFMGREAGYNNETGNFNTFIGQGAGRKNTTGEFNTFIGDAAGYQNQTGSGNVFLGYRSGFSETGSNRLYIDNSDTQSPLIYGEFDTDNTAQLVKINGNFEVTGTASKSGGGSWASSSDERLKDIHGSFTSGLDAIEQLQPVSYRYKAENPLDLPSDEEYVGLVAQEVRQVIPEAVEEDEQGYLLVNNDPIIWTMLNAIKELKAENESLREEMNALKQRFDQ